MIMSAPIPFRRTLPPSTTESSAPPRAIEQSLFLIKGEERRRVRRRDVARAETCPREYGSRIARRILERRRRPRAMRAGCALIANGVVHSIIALGLGDCHCAMRRFTEEGHFLLLPHCYDIIPFFFLSKSPLPSISLSIIIVHRHRFKSGLLIQSERIEASTTKRWLNQFHCCICIIIIDAINS